MLTILEQSGGGEYLEELDLRALQLFIDSLAGCLQASDHLFSLAHGAAGAVLSGELDLQIPA